MTAKKTPAPAETAAAPDAAGADVPAGTPALGAGIPGWPAKIDPDALYSLRLLRPVTIGIATLTPRQEVEVAGSVLATIAESVAYVGPAPV